MIEYRKAIKQDAEQLAFLFDLASGGMINFLLHDLVADKSSVELIAMAVAAEDTAPSYHNCYVAYDGDKVVGMVNCYPATVEQFTAEEKNFLPPDRIKHIKNLIEAKVPGSFYIDSFSILSQYQGQKIGQKLLAIVKDIATEQGYKCIGLFVWADNIGAIRFYQCAGFSKVRDVPVKNHPLLNHENGGYLMKLEIIHHS